MQGMGELVKGVCSMHHDQFNQSQFGFLGAVQQWFHNNGGGMQREEQKCLSLTNTHTGKMSPSHQGGHISGGLDYGKLEFGVDFGNIEKVLHHINLVSAFPIEPMANLAFEVQHSKV